MNRGEQEAEDALRMLRAAVDEVKNEIQRDRGKEDVTDEDVIGVVTTVPQGEISSARYEDGMETLWVWRALESDRKTEENTNLMSRIYRGAAPEAVKITREGIDLLHARGM
jgi:hypothetical protein